MRWELVCIQWFQLGRGLGIDGGSEIVRGYPLCSTLQTFSDNLYIPKKSLFTYHISRQDIAQEGVTLSAKFKRLNACQK
jgi:hypothetical protein